MSFSQGWNCSAKINNVKFLTQGTLYLDVIESITFFSGPTANFKVIIMLEDYPKNQMRQLLKLIGGIRNF